MPKIYLCDSCGEEFDEGYGVVIPNSAALCRDCCDRDDEDTVHYSDGAMPPLPCPADYGNWLIERY